MGGRRTLRATLLNRKGREENTKNAKKTQKHNSSEPRRTRRKHKGAVRRFWSIDFGLSNHQSVTDKVAECRHVQSNSSDESALVAF